MFPPGPPDDLPPPYHDDVIRREHEQMNHRISLLETHIDEIIRKEKDEISHRIEQLETHMKRLETKLVHEPQIDRWTDPKNAICRIPNSGYMEQFTKDYQPTNINTYLLKPLPHYVSKGASLLEFLTNHRHEYLCPCYNCILHDMFGTKGSYDGSKLYQPVLCPLDSDCTCMTYTHRMDFKHSIQVGIIKGRDKELSPIQRYYTSHINHGQNCSLVHVLDEYKGKQHDGTITYSISGVKPPYYLISNCIKRDGIVMFQYKKYNSDIIYETADNLYVITDSFHYPPRDPATFNTSDYYLTGIHILVPVEKYMTDTHFLGKMPRKRKSKSIHKKRKSCKASKTK
jgi:hypothetical protein